MTAPEEQPRQERAWLAAGALIGVVVAGVIIGVLVVLKSGDAGGTDQPANSSSTRAAAPSPGGQLAAARDESLRAAEEAVVVLNTLDHRTVQEGLTSWESVATSPMLDELRTKRAENAALLGGAKTTSTAKVLTAAVSRMSGDTSTADVLVFLEVTVTDANGEPAVKQVREKATLIQTADGWKVSVLVPIQPPA